MNSMSSQRSVVRQANFARYIDQITNTFCPAQKCARHQSFPIRPSPSIIPWVTGPNRIRFGRIAGGGSSLD
jgi:hypothetical protein